MDEYRTFYTTVEGADAALRRDGVAVIPGLLSKSEIERLRAEMFGVLGRVTAHCSKPITEDDPASWRSLHELYPMHSMLLQHWQLGQSQPVWDIRQTDSVIQPFCEIWKTKPADMLVSFDGLSVHFPPELTKCEKTDRERGWFRKGWFHTDQASTKKGRHCVQGFVNLYDVNRGDATLRVLTGSHNSHEKYFANSGIVCKQDWHKVSDQAIADHFSEHAPARVLSKEGDLVLWDSRTIHHGSEPLKGRAEPNTRMAVYVCYTPRRWATKNDLKRKREHFANARVTSHWPHKPRVFGLKPQTYGKPLPRVDPLPKPTVGELGRRLAGFD
nr:2OG-Fe(II) oxygenase superfamily [Oceanusvirus sp.]